MKPVAIFRHTRTEGPGYFATFLEEHSIPWVLIPVDEGAAIPTRTNDYSGICLMGGTISVNDPLPWIDELCALIREAIEKDMPVIGHCLGGQLISKALGGHITKNPVKELGWGTVFIEDNTSAKKWLGARDTTQPTTVFHWHGETFSLPEGAVRILRSEYCANQMFALGKSFGMQCHVEMTPDMISDWCEHWQDEITTQAAIPPSIQTPAQMKQGIMQHLGTMRGLAQSIYAEWIKGLKH